MTYLLILFALSFSLNLIFIIRHRLDKDLYKRLGDRFDELSNEVRENRKFIPGDKILLDMQINAKLSNTVFRVNVEAFILEITRDKVKLNAYSVSGSYPQCIIDKARSINVTVETMLLHYINQDWVTRDNEHMSHIIDQSTTRDIRIDNILNS